MPCGRTLPDALRLSHREPPNEGLSASDAANGGIFL